MPSKMQIQGDVKGERSDDPVDLIMLGKVDEAGRVPEESADEVSRMVFDKLHEKGIKGKERIVWDEIAIAKEKITADRRESARALKQVRDR